MSSAEYLLWRDIQDIIGPASFWPWRVRLYFWTRQLSPWERIRTAAFIWINGLNPEIFYDWCQLKAFFVRGSATHQHYEQLFSDFRHGRRYSMIWSWHVSNGRYEWLDGSVRIPPHRYVHYRMQNRQ